MISVVIPLYNKERHIARTIRSILAQDDPDFELLVVDDGSTDSSAGRVRQFKDPRIRLLQQGNQGESGARNTGLRHARSDYVAFLDADDHWKPNCLGVFRALASRFPEAVVLGAGYVEVLNGKPRRTIIKPAWTDDGLLDYFKTMASGESPFCASSVCVKRSVALELGGFKVGEAMGADLDMWSRLALAGPIAYTPELVAHYCRFDGEGAMNNNWRMPSHTLWRTLNEALASPEPAPRQHSYIRRFLTRKLIGYMSENLVLRGEAQTAYSHLQPYGQVLRPARRLQVRAYANFPAPIVVFVIRCSRFFRTRCHLLKLVSHRLLAGSASSRSGI